MPKTNETRSRLWAGGTFFRSISAGSAMNFIELTISNPTGNVFVLTVNRLDPITNNILEQEIYTVTEAVILGAPAIPPDPNIPNDPGTPAGTDKSSAIPALRSLVNTNSVLIKMKERAIDADGIPVIPPPDIYDTGGDASSISAFSSVLMSGASGAPIPPPSTLRTGPERSMFYVESSEYHPPLYPGDPSFNNEDGHLSPVYKTIEWNGDIHSWVHYQPFV
jgi:hypothetical protein